MTVIFYHFLGGSCLILPLNYVLWEQDIMIIIVHHSKKLSSTGPVGWKFTGVKSKATAGHLEVVYMEGGRS